MTPSSDLQENLRRYLLGQVDAERLEEIEQEFLLNEDEFDELLAAEDALIDDYLNDSLNAEDRAAFEKHFRSTLEREELLQFGRAFRRHLSRQFVSSPAAVQPDDSSRLVYTGAMRPAVHSEVQSPTWWSSALFSSPWRTAAFAVLVLAVGVGIWALFFRQSEVDKGLQAFNAAYRDQRPLEARLSQLGYAPYSATRGAAPDRIDQNQLRRAELILRSTTSGSAKHHALGQVLLSKKEFSDAIAEFNQALESDPKNASTYSDRGAARLSQAQETTTSEGAKFTLLAESLGDFDQALKLAPYLLEALYNRALCLEQMKLPPQAKAAWQTYLEHDSNSQWAEEAKNHLQSLITFSSGAPLANDFVEIFLTAFQAQNEDEAWRSLSRNRDVITGRWIPAKLERAYLSSVFNGQSQHADQMRRGLSYAGELELKRGGDSYTHDLAVLYSSATVAQQHMLKDALDRLDEGYKLCLEAKYADASDRFETAQELFRAAGDEAEANLARYWIAYCDTQLDRIADSLIDLRDVTEFCRSRRYNWLEAYAEDWIATNYSILRQYSDAINYHQKALALSTGTSDISQMQNSLTSLGNLYAYIRQPELSLGCLYRSLSLAAENNGAPRQAWRNLLYASSVFYTFKYYAAALVFGQAATDSAADFNDPSLTYLLHLQLAQTYSRLGRSDDASQEADTGMQLAQSVKDEKARRKYTAAAFLKRAQVWQESGRHRDAVGAYNEAIALYDLMNFSFYRYAAYKGRLLCLEAIGDDGAVAVEIPKVLRLFNENRTQIREEQYRNTFFDTEQDINDIAILHAYQKGEFETAVDYAEQTHGRSLLDALREETHVVATAAGNDRVSSRTSTPARVEEIRQQLPDRVMVLMFTVLPKSVLIWRVSRGPVSVVEHQIDAEDLKQRVSEYAKALSEGRLDQQQFRTEAKELYEILLGGALAGVPVEKTLCIIPDKFLCYVPFAALVSPATDRYLIEERAVFYAASINVLWEFSRAAKEPMVDGLAVAIGNPAFDSDAYPNLSRLGEAEREIQAVSHGFRHSIELIGPNATKAKVLRAMEEAELIHYAGHYVVDDANPLRSKMLLAAPPGSPPDAGVLTASELAQHVFSRTKLIVLSACNTAIDRYYEGEGTVGLARVFLEARIPEVVASQWAVDSDKTADLMIAFYRYRQSGRSTIEALRSAQLQMIAAPDEGHRNPHAWAAFAYVGGYVDS